MNMLVGYGGVALFFVVIVAFIERTSHRASTLTDYATAGRSFGSSYATMAFLNTWLPGTVFVSFAGLAAVSGLIGFYLVPYSLLAVVLMFVLAKPVSIWGHAFDLRTQADLIGVRYDSRLVRVLVAAIGLIASVPWVVLGMQSLLLVFKYLSFGSVGATAALVIGVVVIVLRQVWTVRHGARGLVTGDMVQGIVAYLFGTLLILGLLIYLTTHNHGFSEVAPGMWALPKWGSELGGLYYFSIVITGAMGAWCWPDIFVRLFSARSADTIRRSAVQAAPIMLVFGTALMLLSICASSMPEVKAAPDNVWFIVAGAGGVLGVTLAGLCVLGGTMGNVGGNLQAMGTIMANDVFAAGRAEGTRSPKRAMAAVAFLTLLSGALSLLTRDVTSGLITLALVSYQGIVQIAPALFLGIFWRRATAAGAATGLIGGFGLAAYLQWAYPLAIPWAEGLTSGTVALLVNTALIVGVSLFKPHDADTQARVDDLFDRVRRGDTSAAEPAGKLAAPLIHTLD